MNAATVLSHVARGPQDLYLYDVAGGGRSRFGNKYRRHTRFALDTIDIPFNGQPGYSRKVCATLPPIGDVLRGLTIELYMSRQTAVGEILTDAERQRARSLLQYLLQRPDLVYDMLVSRTIPKQIDAAAVELVLRAILPVIERENDALLSVIPLPPSSNLPSVQIDKRLLCRLVRLFNVSTKLVTSPATEAFLSLVHIATSFANGTSTTVPLSSGVLPSAYVMTVRISNPAPSTILTLRGPTRRLTIVASKGAVPSCTSDGAIDQTVTAVTASEIVITVSPTGLKIKCGPVERLFPCDFPVAVDDIIVGEVDSFFIGRPSTRTVSTSAAATSTSATIDIYAISVCPTELFINNAMLTLTSTASTLDCNGTTSAWPVGQSPIFVSIDNSSGNIRKLVVGGTDLQVNATLSSYADIATRMTPPMCITLAYLLLYETRESFANSLIRRLSWVGSPAIARAGLGRIFNRAAGWIDPDGAHMSTSNISVEQFGAKWGLNGEVGVLGTDGEYEAAVRRLDGALDFFNPADMTGPDRSVLIRCIALGKQLFQSGINIAAEILHELAKESLSYQESTVALWVPKFRPVVLATADSDGDGILDDAVFFKWSATFDPTVSAETPFLWVDYCVEGEQPSTIVLSVESDGARLMYAIRAGQTERFLSVGLAPGDNYVIHLQIRSTGADMQVQFNDDAVEIACLISDGGGESVTVTDVRHVDLPWMQLDVRSIQLGRVQSVWPSDVPNSGVVALHPLDADCTNLPESFLLQADQDVELLCENGQRVAVRMAAGDLIDEVRVWEAGDGTIVAVGVRPVEIRRLGGNLYISDGDGEQFAVSIPDRIVSATGGIISAQFLDRVYHDEDSQNDATVIVRETGFDVIVAPIRVDLDVLDVSGVSGVYARLVRMPLKDGIVLKLGEWVTVAVVDGRLKVQVGTGPTVTYVWRSDLLLYMMANGNDIAVWVDEHEPLVGTGSGILSAIEIGEVGVEELMVFSGTGVEAVDEIGQLVRKPRYDGQVVVSAIGVDVSGVIALGVFDGDVVKAAIETAMRLVDSTLATDKCPPISLRLVKTAELEIGGKTVCKIYGEWAEGWLRMRDLNKRMGLDKMLGDGLVQGTVYMPLPFFFGERDGVALPLATAEDIKLLVEFESEANMGGGDRLNIIGGRLLADVAHLGERERRRMAKNPHTILLQTVEMYQGYVKDLFVTLPLGDQCKELMWVTNPSDAIVSACLQVENEDLFRPRPASYFQTVQPYFHHSGECPDGFAVYSFALEPERMQPTGTQNMSAFCNVVLRYEPKRVLGVDNREVRVYSLHYKVLRLERSHFGTAYQGAVVRV